MWARQLVVEEDRVADDEAYESAQRFYETGLGLCRDVDEAQRITPLVYR